MPNDSVFISRRIYRGSRRVGKEKIFPSFEAGLRSSCRYLRSRKICKTDKVEDLPLSGVVVEQFENTMTHKKEITLKVSDTTIEMEEVK